MQQPGAPEGPPTSSNGAAQRPYSELSNRAILWSGVALFVIGAALVTVLLIAFGNGEHSSQLDAIKTAGTVVLGTGGAAALWLTARRQRTAEITLNQKHLDQAAVDRAFEQNRQHQDRVATATEHDATQRRLSELYLKAVEQLGSDKAAVRHGGLYALERVAQDNPDQQQTVVNVLCAYLRAPFTAPSTSSSQRLGVRRPLLASPHTRATAAGSAIRTKHAHTFQRETNNQVQQEHEVRLTAQRILGIHLQPGPDSSSPVSTFWPNINLDLTGAALSGFTLAHCHLNNARFDSAELAGYTAFEEVEFVGDAVFGGVEFTGDAMFWGAKFVGDAVFEGVEFAGNVIFGGVEFGGYAGFADAKFAEDAVFEHAKFAGDTRFEDAKFAEDAVFDGAKFATYAGFWGAKVAGDARFEIAEFAGYAMFGRAEFARNAKFNHAKFAGSAVFAGAKFAGNATFAETEFAGDAWFEHAEFVITPTFDEAWVKTAGNKETSLSWPMGWASADSQPVPREGKPGLWVPLAAVSSEQAQSNVGEQ